MDDYEVFAPEEVDDEYMDQILASQWAKMFMEGWCKEEEPCMRSAS